MHCSILIKNESDPYKHEFNISKIGKGKMYENISVSSERDVRMVIRLDAYIPDVRRSFSIPNISVGKQSCNLYHQWVRGVPCLVDTGSNFSLFKSKIAEELGLSADDGGLRDSENDEIKTIGGKHVLPTSRHKIYLEIGVYAIPVLVEFPVVPKLTKTGTVYEWDHSLPEENILGMESILDKHMLCFTPEHLFVFENKRTRDTGDRLSNEIDQI